MLTAGAARMWQSSCWWGSASASPSAPQDRVDRPGGEPGAEQLPAELDRVAARDAVADRQRCDGRFEPRTERARAHRSRQLGARGGPAVRAAQAMEPMLAHPHRDLGQLADLMASRQADRLALVLREAMPAAAASGPAIDHLVDRRRGQQLPPPECPGWAPCLRPLGPARSRPGVPGGSWLGGVEELRELRFRRRSSSAIRSSWRATRSLNRWICSSIRSSTATTTRGPAHRSPPPRPAPRHRDSPPRRYVPPTN